MNKRINGFTLIELLAVVTIIGFISVLVLPNILKGINDKKQQISDTNMKILEAAANMYIEQHPNRYVSTFEGDGSTYCIALQELVNSNLLTTPFKDIDGNEVDYSKLLKATYNSNYNTFTYNNALYDNSTCTETINYVSRPILSDGMIPIVYEENTVKKADVNSKWYNYTNRKWANAVLVKDSSRYTYSNAVAGTTINEEDILGYFVWIPRFRYQLFNSDTATEINVVFESVGTIKSTGTQIGEWLTHPAFTYNNQELSGIWVGKYEASNSDNNIVIKSGLTPWTDINYVEANELAIQMTNENNIYGLKGVNTHMTRNSEWGAIAYLTNSKYGNLSDNVSTGNNTGIYNLSGNKEFVIIDNENENSLGYALNETKNWTNNNSYITSENLYLTRGNNSIFSYNNSNLKDVNTTFRVSLTNLEQQNQNYQNNFMVTFDYNMNLLYGLENKEETNGAASGGGTGNKMKYSISNGEFTVTSLMDDGFGYTTARVYLEAGKTYNFTCDTNGIWGGVAYTDTVEAFLALDGDHSSSARYRRMASNNYDFTVQTTGTYHLRLDVNKSGKTYTFSNISVKEKSTTKEVTHGTQYGDLPTPTNKPGYTFMGWVQSNLFDKNSTRNVDKYYIKSDGTTVSHGAYATYRINVKPNTTYTIINSGKSQAPGYVFYDRNNNFISGDGYGKRETITITTPSNAEYMIFSVVANKVAGDEYRYDIDYFQIYEQTVGTVTDTTIITQPNNHTLKGIWKLET